MTDGPTGIQVAPTEGEMTQAQDILRRAISAIVGMSQLQTEVDALRTTVSTLQSDTDRLRQQNAGLDEALYQSRRARQDLEGEAQANKLAMLSAQAERDTLQAQVNSLTLAVEGLKDRLHQAEQGHDAAEFRSMELEDQNKALQTKLDAVREGFKSIFGDEPELAPMPAPTPVSQNVPITESQDGPKPIVEAAPAPSADTSDEWRPGYSWDHERQVYVKEAEPVKPF